MIQSLHVQNFRKHSDFTINFNKNITIITGENGSGKTSLIEAIYIGLVGKSWRSNFNEITRRGCEWWRVDIIDDNQDKRTIKFQNNQKEFNINKQKFSRLPQKNRKDVILFEPQDLNLLYGSPARRRDFIDGFITNLDYKYSKTLSRYNRVLRQRNNLLKNNVGQDELFVWDVQFADLAAEIIETRQRFISIINKLITDEYQKIAGNKDKMEIKYNYGSPSKIPNRQKILNTLHNNYQIEILHGYSSVGPHQHDLEFILNNKPAAETASRGENRTIILALKNIEYQLKKDTSPLILLDDILSEFDEKHQKNLLKNFENAQIIITGVKSLKITKKLAILDIV